MGQAFQPAGSEIIIMAGLESLPHNSSNLRCRPLYGTNAIASISTNAPRGNLATWTVDLAGGFSLKNEAYTSLTRRKSPISKRKIVVFRT